MFPYKLTVDETLQKKPGTKKIQKAKFVKIDSFFQLIFNNGTGPGVGGGENLHDVSRARDGAVAHGVERHGRVDARDQAGYLVPAPVLGAAPLVEDGVVDADDVRLRPGLDR